MMIRWINWIEEHMDGFFKLNAFIWLIWIIVGIGIMFYLFGWPKNSMATWGDLQWDIFKQNMLYNLTDLLICILFFARKHLIFPVVVMYLLHFLSSDLFLLAQILEGNLMFFPTNLLNIVFDQILFTPAILGTIIWARKVFYKPDEE